MNPEPQEQHKWLHRLVGEWEYEVQDAGNAETKGKGTETIRPLGDLWVIGEGKGEVPGGESANTLITIGYSTSTKRYVGSWIGSMMTDLWTYDGEVDQTGQILTLNSEGPHMTDPSRKAKYKDIIEFKNDDHRAFTAKVLGDDGQWQDLMTADYKRVK